jgi:hypothetical protein
MHSRPSRLRTRLRYPGEMTAATPATPAAPLASTAVTRFLHVANGDCTTSLIHEAGLPGTLSVWADVLHDGPVPGGLSDEELLPIRAKFLADDSSAGGGRDGEAADVAAGLMRWRAVIQDTSAYDELVLWYEHDLFDQLNLIQLLALIGQRPPVGKRVSLICIGSFPGRDRFKGLGELTAAELAPLLDTRQPVTQAQYALATRAWDAFRASDPRALEALVRGDAGGSAGGNADMAALPFLEAALRRHLEEFPWTTDGLSRTERRLMELAAAGPIAFADAFPRVHEGETAFYIADDSLLAVIERLAASTPPLMVSGNALTLTDTGRAVLAGEIDRVSHCGIDRWLGGVHLDGRCATWRWNPETRRIVLA